MTFRLDRVSRRDAGKMRRPHPHLKAIEGKFRLSARIARGSEAEVVDFLYMLISPSLRLKIHDYLPNTTLEKRLSGDNIEVAETTENTLATTKTPTSATRSSTLALALKPIRQPSRITTSRSCPKALVLASGTTNREHGVFFKLRPSNGASLEGAKEFTFLAIVPKASRGDWCTLTSPPARRRNLSFLRPSCWPASTSAHRPVPFGRSRGQRMAEQLCQVQEQNSELLTRELTSEAGRLLQSMHDATANSPQDDFDDWIHSIFSQNDER